MDNFLKRNNHDYNGAKENSKRSNFIALMLNSGKEKSSSEGKKQ